MQVVACARARSVQRETSKTHARVPVGRIGAPPEKSPAGIRPIATRSSVLARWGKVDAASAPTVAAVATRSAVVVVFQLRASSALRVATTSVSTALAAAARRIGPTFVVRLASPIATAQRGNATKRRRAHQRQKPAESEGRDRHPLEDHVFKRSSAAVLCMSIES